MSKREDTYIEKLNPNNFVVNLLDIQLYVKIKFLFDYRLTAMDVEKPFPIFWICLKLSRFTFK